MNDVLVVGGGPSGVATAIAAAMRGMSVTVMDPRQGTIDKACGEGLMPTAVAMLTELGVTIPQSRPFAGIGYTRGRWHARGRFPQGPGLGVRRTVLHDALWKRASELGVVRRRERVTHIDQSTDHVTANGVNAKWLIAADGIRSPIRRQLGLEAPTRWAPRYGVRQHFRVAPWSDLVEVHWADGVEAYVTPVADDLVGVAFLFNDQVRQLDRGNGKTPHQRLLDRFPTIAERVGETGSVARGAGPFAHHATHRVCGRVLLVGDAAGYLDPITGEGIKLGMSAGLAAVSAIHDGDVSQYERAWNAIYRPYYYTTGGLLLASKTPVLKSMIVPFLRCVPGAFNRILGSMVG